MKKELIIAIIIGIIGGVTVFTGIKIANDAKNQMVSPQTDQPTPTLSQTTTDTNPTPTSATVSGYKLTITQPQAYQLIESDRMILKGAANPNDQIIIVSDTDSYYLKSDPKGNFDQEVKLTSGYNSVTIFSIDKDNKSQKLDLIFVSSPPAKS